MTTDSESETKKRCTVCKTIKSRTEFPKGGKGILRPECKPCYNFKRRNKYDIAKRVVSTTDNWRKAPEYYDFTIDVRKSSYHAAIDRLHHLGIMSDGWAERARNNVNNLEDVDV